MRIALSYMFLICGICFSPEFTFAQGNLDSRIQAISLDRKIESNLSDNTDCTEHEIVELECMLAEKSNLLTNLAARRLLSYSVNAITELPIEKISAQFYYVGGASALAIYRLESNGATSKEQMQTFNLAAQMWDYLLGEAIKSTDPAVHDTMSNIYAQAYLESRKLGETPVQQTKWLTNLGNSLARSARFSNSTEKSLDALLFATDVRKEIVNRLDTGNFPIRIARALLNQGNGMVQASELLAQNGGVDAGRNQIENAGKQYSRAIDVLLDRTDKTNPDANRLLTTLVSMHSSSMVRGKGDEYRAHRSAIALLKTMRDKWSDRLDNHREVDIALSEIGTRIQLIDRIVGSNHKLELITNTLDILKRYEKDAHIRRPEPDTSISIYSAGVSLYSFRGSALRESNDCNIADGYWQDLKKEIQRHRSVNLRNIQATLRTLVDCKAITELEPGQDDFTVALIHSKERWLEEYVRDIPDLAQTQILYASELIHKWRVEAGTNSCKAANFASERLPAELFSTTPQLWATWLTHQFCNQSTQRANQFTSEIRDWLITRERTEAGSRSGHALLSRRLHQPLTDMAILLARNEMFPDALWFLDFRDRSRDQPQVRKARSTLASVPGAARKDVLASVEDWLKYDEPTDIERSFSMKSFVNGRLVLKSESAAELLDLNTLSSEPLAVDEIARRTIASASNQVLAWLLIGTENSGWIVIEPTGKFAFIPLNVDRPWLKSLLATKYADPNVPTSESLDFFLSRSNSHNGSGQIKLTNLNRWRLALATTATHISNEILTPLYNNLSNFADARSPKHLALIVRNELADMPLHAIPTDNSLSCGPSLIDCFTVSYASDPRSLLNHPGSAMVGNANAFWGFSDDTNMTTSLSQYEQLFLNNPQIATTTEPEKAMATLDNNGTVLWLVHGEFNESQPFDSTINLSHESILTPSDIIMSAPDLSALDLLILVGCDGAIFDKIVEPTEQRGLSESFLSVGAKRIIVPAWRAETVASFVFTSHLMQSISTGASAADAFRSATLFLRDASMPEILNLALGDRGIQSGALLHLLQSRAQASGNSPPFSDLSRFGSFKLLYGS